MGAIELLVRNKGLTGRYIDGIATLPEYQRRGLVSKCITDDIATFYQNGIGLPIKGFLLQGCWG